MRRFLTLARVLVVIVPLTACVPLARVLVDWLEVSRMLPATDDESMTRGFDWVVWEETDGLISAAYVFPRGPGAEAGIRKGDVFYTLDGQQYFNADDVQRAVEGIPPGERRTYYLVRGSASVIADVRVSRYPTFLYPLSAPLWQFAVWGFTVGAFLHLLGLIIVGPLAWRSAPARFSLLLITVSALWVFGNLLRLVLVSVLGPPEVPGGLYDRVFLGLTVVGLVGWIGFPALLVRKVLGDARGLGVRLVGPVHLMLYLPPALLGGLALLTTFGGPAGPFTLDGLIAPILFYACCYVALAALLILALYGQRRSDADELAGTWSRPGSGAMLVIALLGALSVLGVVPILGAVTETIAGWLIVSAQLLSVAPVVLVTVATLKHGKVDLVLRRAITYLTVLGLIFFAFVGGVALLDPYLLRMQAPRTAVLGLYVVLLLVVFERLARRLRVYAAGFFATERQQRRQTLSRFQEQMRNVLDFDALARQTIQVVGDAFGARSAIIFLRTLDEPARWISHTYHPEPPYLTERIVRQFWPHLEREGRIWARNPELDESTLPPELSRMLQERGAALAVPVMGDGAPTGVVVLGPKRQRRAVYNLEDLDLLRSLSGQLALALERLKLVEREKALVRESAEAQLTALRAQINPHFLFNALNTIVALIEERPDEAEATVENLAAIFRHILVTGGEAYVPLESEMALVQHYLAIEQARFGDHLQVELALDPDVRGHPVPAFVVQTLVENAVKHGLEPRRGGGTLRLATRPHEGGVEVVVADTGVGIPALYEAPAGVDGAQPFFGIGLRNVAARLEKLYGRTDLLRLTSRVEAGTTARLLLPPPADAAHPDAAATHSLT